MTKWSSLLKRRSQTTPKKFYGIDSSLFSFFRVLKVGSRPFFRVSFSTNLAFIQPLGKPSKRSILINVILIGAIPITATMMSVIVISFILITVIMMSVILISDECHSD